MVKKIIIAKSILGIALALTVTHESSAMLGYKAQQKKIKRDKNENLDLIKKIDIKKKKINDIVPCQEPLFEIVVSNFIFEEKAEKILSIDVQQSFLSDIISLHTKNLRNKSEKILKKNQDCETLLKVLIAKKLNDTTSNGNVAITSNFKQDIEQVFLK